jgi:tetratricopeptide (TPR) repeat protein
LIEKFPPVRPASAALLIDHIYTADGAQQADSWAAARAKRDQDYWLEQYVRWRAKQHTAKPLLDALLKQVNEHPQDFAISYRLAHLISLPAGVKSNLGDLSAVFKPRLAWHAFRLAEAITPYSPACAARLYERSLALPFTAEDRALITEYARKNWAMANSPSQIDWQKMLRSSTDENLAHAYTAAHEVEKAHKLVIKMSEAQSKDGEKGVPPVSLAALSGQIQRDLLVHPIEKSIVAAESDNKNSPDYWQKRALYYTGRKEKDEAQAAFEKALQLTPLKSETDQCARAGILNQYMVSMRSLPSPDCGKLTRIVLREYSLAEPGSYYMNSVLGELIYFADQSWMYGTAMTFPITMRDERLWQHFKTLSSWNIHTSDLIGKVADTVPEGSKEEFWSRLVDLTKVGDGSQSFWLSNRLRRSNRVNQSIDELRQCIKQSKDNFLISAAKHDLFECYIEKDDCNNAEKIWHESISDAPVSTQVSYLDQLAVAAARSHNQAQALSYWQKKSSLDRSDLNRLSELSRLGMQETLVGFYKEMLKKDPKSSVPARALALLGVKGF